MTVYFGKFKAMASFRARAKQKGRGFTLIELLIVIAIIGVIATLLIPELLVALNKSKQKRTMADMRAVGQAMMAFRVDQAGAAASGGSPEWRLAEYSNYHIPPTTLSFVLTEWLDHEYISELPIADGWGNPYYYTFPIFEPFAINAMSIVSCGRSGGGGCMPDSTYPIGPYKPTLFDNHIVWADGTFVFYPGR